MNLLDECWKLMIMFKREKLSRTEVLIEVRIFIIMNSLSFILIISIFLATINDTLGIKNGQLVTGNQFNYQVTIFKRFGPLPECTGTIIDEYHLLTAAHCIFNDLPEQLLIAAALLSIRNFNAVYRKVIEIHLHEGFDVNADIPENVTEYDWHLQYEENDIAVLKIDPPFVWSDEVGKLTLPVTSFSYCNIARFAGWGEILIDQVLQINLLWTEMIILNSDDCRNQQCYHGMDEFCAEDPDHSAAIVRGDSGGPLVVDGVVVGLCVGVYENGVYAGIFVDVYYHLNFINRIIHP